MLNCVPTEVNKFSNINDLKDYVENEEVSTKYVDMPQNLHFEEGDNMIVGDRYQHWNFNESGIKALFNATDVHGLYSTMTATKVGNTASYFLNTLFREDHIKNRLKNKRLVVSNDEIIGVVGSRYNPYSNRQFLDDLKPETKGMELSRAVVSNTKMTASFNDKYYGFKLKGGKDKIEIGQTIVNSGIGDRALAFKLWLLSLICGNGMTIRSNLSELRAVHSGYDSLKPKMLDMMANSRNQYKAIRERIETLLEIPYTDHTADRLLWNKAPINIIPDLKKKKLWNPDKKFSDPDESVKDLERSINIVNNIPRESPYGYGGEHTQRVWESSYRDQKSMFHFVGAFTEHAQTCDPETQIDIEEKAGVLTNWIAKHKEKLLN